MCQNVYQAHACPNPDKIMEAFGRIVINLAFSIINNDFDTTDFLLTNWANEKDIIELMKHKGIMSEDIEVAYNKDGKAILKLKRLSSKLCQV